MAERFKAHAWKVCIPSGIVGSNPTLSAIFEFFINTMWQLSNKNVSDIAFIQKKL